MCIGDGRLLGCARKRWDFEDGGNPWKIRSDGTDDHVAQSVTVSTAQAHLGTKAARIDVSIRSGHYRMLLDATASDEALCPVGGVDLVGRTASLQIYIDSPVAPSAQDYCRLDVYTGPRPGQVGQSGGRVFVPLRQWTRLEYKNPQPGAPRVSALGVDCIFTTVTPWTGAVYIDDMGVD